MSFNPNPPIAGQSFHITVSSGDPLTYVSLEGPGNPVFDGVVQDGDTYQWVWTANVDSTGQQNYNFKVDDETCTSNFITVQSSVTSAAACFGDEHMSYSPAMPYVGDPLTIEITSSQAHTNVGVHGTSPTQIDSIQPGGLGTIWRFHTTPTQGGLNQYDFLVEGVSCASITIPVHEDTSGE